MFLYRLPIQDDYGVDVQGGGSGGEASLGCGIPWWNDFRQRVSRCLTNVGTVSGTFLGIPGTGGQDDGPDSVLVEVKQVMHPVCSTLRVFDMADTSVTNIGLLSILRKMPQLQSLGEYCISDHFLRGLCVVNSLKMDKFGESSGRGGR